MALSRDQSLSPLTSRMSGKKGVDIQVSVIKGRGFKNPHKFKSNVSNSLKLELDDQTNETNILRSKGGDVLSWEAHFVYSVTTSSNINIRLFCKHQKPKEDHVVGEANFDAIGVERYKDFEVALYDTAHTRQQIVAGYVTLHVKVAISVTFDNGPISDLDLRSQVSLQQLERIIGSTTSESFKKLSSSWASLFNALNSFAPIAQKVAALDCRAQLAVNAVAFAIKILVEQVERDDKVDNLGNIMQELYQYVLDLSSTRKILSYQKTLERLLSQTSECAYFIAEYKRVTVFAQRLVGNLTSNADTMISNFERAFGELKIGLILGSTLQTTIVTYRILRKVENIENLIYIDYLPTLNNVGWDSSKTCLRGTREETVENVVRWASQFSETLLASRICVLLGPPDSGKSTIVHTVAQTFHAQNRLGAGIFLHEDVANANSQTISSTIVEQLARYDPQLRARIADKIKSDKSLASADIGRQFPGLVVQTTSTVGVDESELMMIGPVLILIDSLDVIGDREQHKTLNVIADYSQKLPSNFRILITGRPGGMVETSLGHLPYSEIHTIGFDNLDDHSLDLGQYISRCTTALLAQKPDLHEIWSEQLESQFYRRSMGMHFWVSMASRVLLESSGDDGSVILNILFSNQMPHSKEETMDHLYYAILRTPTDYLQYPVPPKIILDILIKHPQPMSFSQLLQATCIPEDAILMPLNNILSWLKRVGLVVEKLEHDQSALLHVSPSLEDFLTNPRRCSGTEAYVDRETSQISSAEICLSVMDRLLRHNICSIEDPMLLNSEILELDRRIQAFVPTILEYSCYTWICHVQNLPSGLSPNVHQRIEKFLSTQLLCWIEAMSLLGHFDRIKADLYCLLDSLDGHVKHHSNFYGAYAMSMDAIFFIRMFSPLLSKAGMQTYISALPLMPSDSLLFTAYSQEVVFGRSQLASDCRIEWKGINPSSASLKWTRFFSPLWPGSSLIALFSSLPNEPLVWESENGEKKKMELAALYSMCSIAFSADGRYVAVGHRCGPIAIFDTEKALLVYVIQHTFDAPLLRYSSDGRKLLILSSSTTVSILAIWDTISWELLEEYILSVHFQGIYGVAFSCYGNNIALYDDLGVQIFDTTTVSGTNGGKRLSGPHNLGITALKGARLVWSIDGNYLASVSLTSNTVCVWSIQEDTVRRISLEDWSVPSVLILSDDMLQLVSLEEHRDTDVNGALIRLKAWETESGKLINKTFIESVPQEYVDNRSHFFLQDGHGLLGLREYKYDIVASSVTFFDCDPAYLTKCYNSPNSKLGPTIQYHTPRQYSSSPYARNVDPDGWIRTDSGEKQLWVPYPNFELSISHVAEDDPLELHATNVEVLEPQTGKSVLRITLRFTQKLQ